MERFEAMRVFLRVAELTSFTKAAETLGLPKASVSAAVAQLEAMTGARLLQRTTRKVSVTPDGQAFYERCRDLLADCDEIETMFQSGADLKGRLRVDMPMGVAKRVVFPALPEFLEAHPGLDLEISSTDRQVDLVGEGFDCVVRVGYPGDSGVMVRPVGKLVMVNCVSPAYLQRYGSPRTPAELLDHRLIHYSPRLGVKALGFEYFDGQRWQEQPVDGSITVNNSEAYRLACLAGLGLIQVPRLGVREDLESGTLVEVMADYPAEPMPVSLLYPHRRNLSRRVIALMDWLEALLVREQSSDNPAAPSVPFGAV